MKRTLKEIAALLPEAQIIGDSSIAITGIASIKEAKEGDIAFISNSKYLHFVNGTKASAIIAQEEIKGFLRPVIKVDNPSLVFTKIVSLFYPERKICNKGIHPTVVLGSNAIIGKDVSIGPYTVIEDDVKIGDRCVIYSGVFIGYGTSIGDDCLIWANVSIREKASIGRKVIIHNGAVIGSDGFGYETVDKEHYKIPQVGCVVIEDDVEIGANVTIDRARFDKTIIGKGTKIDNLVHIAHNVTTGKNCIIVAQVGISGSTTLGSNVILAGQAGLAGHLAIGDNAIVGAQAGVTKSVASNTFVSGYPARPHKEALKIDAYIKRLPEFNDNVAELKKRIERIEAKIAKTKPQGALSKNKRYGKAKNNKKRS